MPCVFSEAKRKNRKPFRFAFRLSNPPPSGKRESRIASLTGRTDGKHEKKENNVRNYPIRFEKMANVCYIYLFHKAKFPSSRRKQYDFRQQSGTSLSILLSRPGHAVRGFRTAHVPCGQGGPSTRTDKGEMSSGAPSSRLSFLQCSRSRILRDVRRSFPFSDINRQHHIIHSSK